MYKKISGSIADILKITIGAALMGAALSIFLVPFKIAPGGMSGLATVIHYLTGWRVGILIALVNIPIFILGLLNFDTWFLLRSAYGTLALSAATELFSNLSIPIDDPLLGCFFGGALMGFGISVVMRAGGTTGGTDILVLVIRKSFASFSVGQLFMLIDGIIITVAGITSGSWETVLYSAVALFISTYVTDTAIEGVKFARLVYIISPRSREITQRIYSELERGVTGISSVSMYTGKNDRILMCAIRKHELPRLKRIVTAVDPGAFVIISDAKEVMGNGFEVRSV